MLDIKSVNNARCVANLYIAYLQPLQNQQVQRTEPTKLVPFQYVWNADVIHLTGEGIEIGTVQ